MKTVRATTVAAAETQTPAKKEADRNLILDALFRAGRGLTDQEIEDATGIAGNTERWRRRELVKEGKVYESGANRPTRSGALATVWQIRL